MSQEPVIFTPQFCRFFGETGLYFPKLSLNSEINFISVSFKNDISILNTNTIAKKLQILQFLQNFCPKKQRAKKSA